MAFQAVEYELQDNLLPALFQGATSKILRRAITGLLVKQSGIALPTNSDSVGELDGVLRHHGKPRRRDSWDSRIQVGQPYPPDGGGEGRDPTATYEGHRDRPGRGPGCHIQAGRPKDGDYSADGGVAVSASLNRQWYGVRGEGMEEFPIPALQHRATQISAPL